MTLKETIMDQQKQAMKAKDQDRLATLRMVWSALRNQEIDKQRDLTDDEVQEIVARQMKQLHDALVDFKQANRTDLIEKTEKEISLLAEFLPAQLTDEELEGIVRRVCDTLGTNKKSDFGKIMGTVSKETKGRADGNRVKQIVERLCE